MDKKVSKKKKDTKKLSYTVGGILVACLLIYQFVFADRRDKLSVDRDRLSIETVEKGTFQEFIVEVGEVVPSKTIYLDAVEGGNIVRVIKESGAEVKKGEPIIELENANLRLSVLSQENALNEQINRVRTTRLQLDQNYLSQKQELAQIDNQLQILGPKFRRDSVLFSKELISKQEYEKTVADYQYNLKRKQFTKESFDKDSAARVLQLQQLSSSEMTMIENLKGVQKILDNLIIKAPMDGQLSTKQLQEGQNINKGERIGQVDVVGSYKVRVPIDEIYLSRISVGLKARAQIGDEERILKISYIYPAIEEGNFKVDMEFEGEVPEGLVTGQSVRLKIALGNSSKELLVPVGGFFNNTGGNWIFVVEENKNRAVKRNIQLGRKNTDYYEVIDGLKEGEIVITSSYDNFGDNEVLTW